MAAQGPPPAIPPRRDSSSSIQRQRPPLAGRSTTEAVLSSSPLAQSAGPGGSSFSNPSHHLNAESKIHSSPNLKKGISFSPRLSPRGSHEPSSKEDKDRLLHIKEAKWARRSAYNPRNQAVRTSAVTESTPTSTAGLEFVITKDTQRPELSVKREQWMQTYDLLLRNPAEVLPAADGGTAFEGSKTIGQTPAMLNTEISKALRTLKSSLQWAKEGALRSLAEMSLTPDGRAALVHHDGIVSTLISVISSSSMEETSTIMRSLAAIPLAGFALSESGSDGFPELELLACCMNALVSPSTTHELSAYLLGLLANLLTSAPVRKEFLHSLDGFKKLFTVLANLPMGGGPPLLPEHLYFCFRNLFYDLESQHLFFAEDGIDRLLDVPFFASMGSNTVHETGWLILLELLCSCSMQLTAPKLEAMCNELSEEVRTEFEAKKRLMDEMEKSIHSSIINHKPPVIPSLIRCLGESFSDQCRLEACRLIGHLTIRSENLAALTEQRGLVKAICQLACLTTTEEARATRANRLLSEASVQVLCNITRDNEAGVNQVSMLSEHDVIASVLNHLTGQHSANLEFQIKIAQFLEHMTRFQVGSRTLANKGAIPVLQGQVSSPNRLLKGYVSRALSVLRRLRSTQAEPDDSANMDDDTMNRLRQEAASREEKDAQYRVKVVSELLETEKTYVENLIIMMTIFKPLVSLSPVLEKFHQTIDVLLHVHTKFLQSLQKRDIDAKQQRGREMHIGDLIGELSDCLGIYRDYTLDYEQLQVAIEEPSIKKQLQREQDILSHDSLRISSLLILPIQRVPRYTLIFQDLVDHMSGGHPDLEDLEASLEKVNKLLNALDEERAETTATNRVSFYRDRIENCPCELRLPHRKYIHKGLIMSQLVGETTLDEVSWFLFNDIIVEAVQINSATAEDEKRFRCRKIFTLCDIEITSMEEMGAKLTGDLPSRNMLRVFCRGMAYNIYAKTPADKDVWLNNLMAAIQINRHFWEHEQKGNKHVARIYFGDTGIMRELGLDRTFKTIIVTSDMTAVEMEEQIRKQITRSLDRYRGSKVIRETARYRLYHRNALGELNLMAPEDMPWQFVYCYGPAHTRLVFNPFPLPTPEELARDQKNTNQLDAPARPETAMEKRERLERERREKLMQKARDKGTAIVGKHKVVTGEREYRVVDKEAQLSATQWSKKPVEEHPEDMQAWLASSGTQVYEQVDVWRGGGVDAVFQDPLQDHEAVRRRQEEERRAEEEARRSAAAQSNQPPAKAAPKRQAPTKTAPKRQAPSRKYHSSSSAVLQHTETDNTFVSPHLAVRNVALEAAAIGAIVQQQGPLPEAPPVPPKPTSTQRPSINRFGHRLSYRQPSSSSPPLHPKPRSGTAVGAPSVAPRTQWTPSPHLPPKPHSRNGSGDFGPPVQGAAANPQPDSPKLCSSSSAGIAEQQQTGGFSPRPAPRAHSFGQHTGPQLPPKPAPRPRLVTTHKAAPPVPPKNQ